MGNISQFCAVRHGILRRFRRGVAAILHAMETEPQGTRFQQGRRHDRRRGQKNIGPQFQLQLQLLRVVAIIGGNGDARGRIDRTRLQRREFKEAVRGSAGKNGAQSVLFFERIRAPFGDIFERAVAKANRNKSVVFIHAKETICRVDHQPLHKRMRFASPHQQADFEPHKPPHVKHVAISRRMSEGGPQDIIVPQSVRREFQLLRQIELRRLREIARPMEPVQGRASVRVGRIVKK